MSRLDELPPDQRAALSLLLQQRKTYAQVAALLGIPERAVHDRAHAALAILVPAPGPRGPARTPRRGRRLPARPAAGRRRTPAHADVPQQLRAGARLGARRWPPSSPSWTARSCGDIPPAGAAASPQSLSELRSAAAAASAAEATPVASLAPDPAASPPPPASAQSSLPSSRVGGAVLLAVIIAAVIVAAVLLDGRRLAQEGRHRHVHDRGHQSGRPDARCAAPDPLAGPRQPEHRRRADPLRRQQARVLRRRREHARHAPLLLRAVALQLAHQRTSRSAARPPWARPTASKAAGCCPPTRAATATCC